MSKQTSPLRSARWVLLLFIAIGGLSQTLLISCQPVPLSIQWGNPIVCKESTNNEGTLVSAGALIDVQATVGGQPVTVARPLPLQLRIFSQMAFNSDSARLIPESNFITIDKITYFYTYPANFSLPQDPTLLPESSPREQPTFLRIEPKIQANTQGGGQGATITTDPNSTSDKLISNFMPRSLAETLLNAQELNSGNQSFDIMLNVKASGTTGWGSKVETNILRFPITVCKGCTGCVIGDQEKADVCAGLNGFCVGGAGGN